MQECKSVSYEVLSGSLETGNIVLQRYFYVCTSLKLTSCTLCPGSRGVSTKAPNYCIVMEYCGEGSLYEVIQKRTEILPPEVIKWAGQIASGMHFLHSKKIIHRDLKSAK